MKKHKLSALIKAGLGNKNVRPIRLYAWNTDHTEERPLGACAIGMAYGALTGTFPVRLTGQFRDEETGRVRASCGLVDRVVQLPDGEQYDVLDAVMILNDNSKYQWTPAQIVEWLEGQGL